MVRDEAKGYIEDIEAFSAMFLVASRHPNECLAARIFCVGYSFYLGETV